MPTTFRPYHPNQPMMMPPDLRDWLPEGDLVLPGHGGDTTIGASKAEFAVFKSRPRPADLHGHVAWAG